MAMTVQLDTVTKTIYKEKAGERTEVAAYVQVVDDLGKVLEVHCVSYNPLDEKAFSAACQKVLDEAKARSTEIDTLKSKIGAVLIGLK